MTQTDSTYQFLGKGRKIIDGMEKVTGRARYVADLRLPGMLHARPILSPYAHAKIMAIDDTTFETFLKDPALAEWITLEVVTEMLPLPLAIASE